MENICSVWTLTPQPLGWGTSTHTTPNSATNEDTEQKNHVTRPATAALLLFNFRDWCGRVHRDVGQKTKNTMIFVSYKFRYSEGSDYFYAIGEQSLVRECCTRTFKLLDWSAKWKEDRISHYPGGWVDRAGSAYSRTANISGTLQGDLSGSRGPHADIFWIEVSITNNPSVSLLQTHVYLKQNWFNKKKQQERLEAFYRSLTNAFQLFEIPLIPDSKWSEVCHDYPQIRCSPVWANGRREAAPNPRPWDSL